MSEIVNSESARLRGEAARLRDALVDARMETARQADHAFQMDAQRSELMRRLAEAIAKAAQSAATRRKLRDLIETLEAESKQMTADRAALSETVNAHTAQLAAATNEINQLNARIRTFKNSVSWKVTLPIRKVAMVAKRLRSEKSRAS